MIIVGIIALGWAALTGLYVLLNWAPELTVEELRQRWGGAPSAFLNVAGMKVHLRDEGPKDDPSPVVLLHGTLSSLHTWDGWAAALRGERRVIRIDLAGHGLTGGSLDGSYSIDNDVRLVIALLDALGIGRCVLGGNSLGGAVAWRTALDHPSRVEKLILVDADGYRTRPISQPIAFYLAWVPTLDWMVRHTFPRGLIEQGLQNVYGDRRKVTKELKLRYRRLTQCKGNRQALIERGRQWLRPGADISGRIAELNLPTLIIWGSRDRLIPPESARRFHRDIVGSTMVMFAGLGHLPQEEDPVLTVAAVQQFLGSA
jgi:pimeloyl-ACP methyl ester carboxylesterase